jgi:hypothetical protein
MPDSRLATCALPRAIASIEANLCRVLSINCSAFAKGVASKTCRFRDFGTIPLPKKLLTLSQKISHVLHVTPVLAAPLSWRNGKKLDLTQPR